MKTGTLAFLYWTSTKREPPSFMGWGSFVRCRAGKKSLKQVCETISHATASNIME